MLPRSTLGLYRSQQPDDSSSPSAPNASAVRTTVPRLAGSCMSSRAIYRPILFIVSKAARLSRVLQIQNIPCGDAVSPKWRDISSEISTYAASAPLPRRMACSCSP